MTATVMLDIARSLVADAQRKVTDKDAVTALRIGFRASHYVGRASVLLEPQGSPELDVLTTSLERLEHDLIILLDTRSFL